MLDLSRDTVLDLEGWGILPGSGRGLRQSIAPVPNGALHYTVWGDLETTARESLNRFKLTITGDDVWPPAFAGLWLGQDVTVHCVSNLPQPQPATMGPIRPPVPGSLIYLDGDMNELPTSAGAVWLNFRPILLCKVNAWNIEESEWEATATSSIEFWERSLGA